MDRGKSTGPTWEAMGCGVRGMLTNLYQSTAAPWPLKGPPHNYCHTEYKKQKTGIGEPPCISAMFSANKLPPKIEPKVNIPKLWE